MSADRIDTCALHPARRSLILNSMSIFPKPVSPKSALGDFWSYFAQPRAHKWPLLGVAAAVTWVIMWAFVLDAKTNTGPKRYKITYVQSWDANRSDAVIIAKQKADLAKGELMLAKKQKEMQALADMTGIEWREEAARNAVKRDKALKEINALLDARLAKAKALEATMAPKTVAQKSDAGKSGVQKSGQP
ncbi:MULTISPECIES: hypothetical protein [unclassified Sphingobium]|uniref:hypothetical protein n=1 Tax=unclassified Sphingobium TaxID=2611147 RepID=UPI001E4ADA8B|nr:MULTISPECIES: hypothetical protein [unclassified Sphingobium]CAH0349105.1 hypothetical protein SPH9361_00438 [Sphingobium sp. CECT 9361]